MNVESSPDGFYVQCLFKLNVESSCDMLSLLFPHFNQFSSNLFSPFLFQQQHHNIKLLNQTWNMSSSGWATAFGGSFVPLTVKTCHSTPPPAYGLIFKLPKNATTHYAFSLIASDNQELSGNNAYSIDVSITA